MWGIPRIDLHSSNQVRVAVDVELLIFLRSRSVLFLLLCPLLVVLGGMGVDRKTAAVALRCLCWGGSSVVDAHRPARLAAAN